MAKSKKQEELERAGKALGRLGLIVHGIGLHDGLDISGFEQTVGQVNIVVFHGKTPSRACLI